MVKCYAQQIDHYVTAIQDIERAVHFYTDVLGGQVKRRDDVYAPERDPFNSRPPSAFLQLGTVELGLFGDELYGLPYRKFNRGIPRWAYEVATEDFPKLLDRLRAAGAKFDGPDGNEGDDAAHVWLHDPEGNFVEFVDRGTPKRRPQDEIEIIRLDRVEYETVDINKTADFYTNSMGFEEAGRGRSPEGHPYVDLRLPTSGQIFRFHRVEELSIQTSATFRGNHLAFYVPREDFGAACEQLERYGVDHHDERGDRIHGDLRIVRRETEGGGDGTYFPDPSGYKLQYIAHAGTYLDEAPVKAAGAGQRGAH
ncbi:MAG: glyoxylase family protein [Chloroflexota bacterium]|jgi:catechol 2,3-dioxygenase-like lactoylglutathione lyase family enzyme|nr:glyoxylase family protein [Chloroflexota bacterium]